MSIIPNSPRVSSPLLAPEGIYRGIVISVDEHSSAASGIKYKRARIKLSTGFTTFMYLAPTYPIRRVFNNPELVQVFIIKHRHHRSRIYPTVHPAAPWMVEKLNVSGMDYIPC